MKDTLDIPVKLLAVLALSGLAAAGAPVSCDSLASAALPHVTIISAKNVAAGEFSLPEGSRGPATAFKSLPAFCRVAGVIKPSDDSNIQFEVWMPASGWNGKFQGIGNGGFESTNG